MTTGERGGLGQCSTDVLIQRAFHCTRSRSPHRGGDRIIPTMKRSAAPTSRVLRRSMPGTLLIRLAGQFANLALADIGDVQETHPKLL